MKREYWELINNKTRLVISLFFNAIVLYIVYNKFINTEDGYIQIVLILGRLLIILSSFVVMSEKLIKEFENGTIFSLIITPYTLSSILLSEILTENILNIIKLILSFVIVENSYSINYIYYMMFLFIGNLGLYGIDLIIASISLISRDFKLVANIFRVIFIYKKILVDLILYKNFSFSYYPINFL